MKIFFSFALWIALAFQWITEPKSEPMGTLARIGGIFVLMAGFLLVGRVSSAPAIMTYPVISVAVALLGLLLVFIGFALLMTRKKG